MKYHLYIKSYTDIDDYEAEVEANNIEEAAHKFVQKDKSLGFYTLEELLKNIEEI